MGSFRYEIDISDYRTRVALRYLLLENFEIGELKYRHSLDGETTTATLPIKLKPDKWNDKYNHSPDDIK